MYKYYSLEEILKHDSQYYIIFGQRSNGKSYAVDKYVLDNYFNKGEEFVIVKRYNDELKRTIAETMLTPLYDYVFEEYGYYIRFFQGKWLASDDKDLPLSKWNIIGYAQTLNSVDKFKGSQYPNVTTIVFEEFMSTKGDYLVDEVNIFMNVVSTIVRKRTNVKVFLLGNTISKYSPYSDSLGVRLDKIKQGQIIDKAVEYNGTITKFTIERTKNVQVIDNEKMNEKISYTNFGKKNSKMINFGEFEISGEYPIIRNGIHFLESEKFLKDFDKKLRFKKENKTDIFIEFNGEIYNIYINKDTKDYIVGIKIMKDKIGDKKNRIILNPSKDYRNSIVVYNIRTFTLNRNVNKMLDIIVNSYQNNMIVYENEEVGEDIKTAFRNIGL